jgi:tetratricopeptide (TPR) repeat protein
MRTGKTQGLLVGLLCLVLGTTCTAPQDTAWDAHVAAAKKAFQQGDYAEAESQFRAALEKAEGFGSQNPRLAISLNNLASLYRVQGRYAEAGPLYKRALAIHEKALGPEHPDVAKALEKYAALLRETGRNAEADRLDARAKAIRAKQTKENPSN